MKSLWKTEQEYLGTYSVDSDLSSGTDEVGVKQSNSDVAFGLGYFNGFLSTCLSSFMVVLSSSVLDEKTSKVVEVIISSIKPTQLMMGKVLGVGAEVTTNIYLDYFSDININLYIHVFWYKLL